uniref:E3 ubiquitin protein ligase n=1 Tax=Rhizophora mucronata TaxID=61149 RepID=A0A2P2MV24_RHIMU
METKLEEASKEPGRKEIIADFKALVSSFPDEMGSMQRQLNSYKEAALDIHSLHADMQSLSSILERKAKECQCLCATSASQVSEIQDLEAVVWFSPKFCFFFLLMSVLKNVELHYLFC